jgi:hypothetical protein
MQQTGSRTRKRLFMAHTGMMHHLMQTGCRTTAHRITAHIAKRGCLMQQTDRAMAHPVAALIRPVQTECSRATTHHLTMAHTPAHMTAREQQLLTGVTVAATGARQQVTTGTLTRILATAGIRVVVQHQLTMRLTRPRVEMCQAQARALPETILMWSLLVLLLLLRLVQLLVLLLLLKSRAQRGTGVKRQQQQQLRGTTGESLMSSTSLSLLSTFLSRCFPAEHQQMEASCAGVPLSPSLLLLSVRSLLTTRVRTGLCAPIVHFCELCETASLCVCCQSDCAHAESMCGQV